MPPRHAAPRRPAIVRRQAASRIAGRGITLLELVVVILVGCLLLAVALPRYHDAQRYARMALLSNLALTMHSASNLFHLQCLAASTRVPRGDCTQMRIGLVTVRGEAEFPQAGLDGIGRLVGLTPGDPAADLFSTESVLYDGLPALKVAVRAAEKGTCELVYRAPSGPGQRPEVLTLLSTCP